MKPPVRVAIIVPTLNREEVLADTLSSLFALEYPKDKLDILVVDQTVEHEPRIRAFLAQADKRGDIRWFRPPQVAFASLTKARNFGMAQAGEADCFIFVDDDVEVRPDFVRQHLAGYTDASIGATVGKVTVPGHRYSKKARRVGQIGWFGAFTNNYHIDGETESGNFIGCNFSLRADIVPETGIFDEEFIGNALREDTDMAVRVRESGYKIRYLPKAAVLHKYLPSGGTRSQQSRIEWYYALFYNNMLFYAKHAKAWRLPFFILHLWKPILACSFYYGRGRWPAVKRPWQGIRDGVKAAGRSRKAKMAVPRKSPLNPVL